MYSVIEKLKGLGFMELYVKDLGIGFEMEMYSYEPNRYMILRRDARYLDVVLISKI